MKNKSRKVVFITAPYVFRDEEYLIPKKILESNNIAVTTASTKLGKIYGKFGLTTLSNVLIQDITENLFDAIVFIGGTGAEIFFNNHYALNLAKEFATSNRVTAAICIAPIILAKAKILVNRKSTAFIDAKDTLLKYGAIYTGASVEVDLNIITANGPMASQSFGNEIVKQIISVMP